MTSSEIKAAAKRFGADLVGIAATDGLAYLPKEENPLSIFPQARSVIVIARKIPRGTLRGIEQGTELDNSFHQFGLYHLEDQFLARTSYDLTIWMEAQGFEAVPLFAYDDAVPGVGVPVAEGKPAPNVMLKYRILAQAAGLGETGLNGLFLTPEFGPRQRFAFLLTDAEVAADQASVPSLCDDCGVCVSACPLNALDAGHGSPAGYKGYERPVAARDNRLCLQCRNGAVQTNAGRFNTVDRLAAACSRACVKALEQRGGCGETFKNKFEQSTPWGRDLFGETIKTQEARHA